MSLAAAAIRLAESAPLPDPLTRVGVAILIERTHRRAVSRPDEDEARLLAELDGFPTVIHTDAANAQHYELPPNFFLLILGPRLKYSCCLYPDARTTLAEAERLALDAAVARAGLADGQSVLEVGCGWGSRTRSRNAPSSSARSGGWASRTSGW